MAWIRRAIDTEGECPRWVIGYDVEITQDGVTPSKVRLTSDKFRATRYNDYAKERLGESEGLVWEYLDTKTVVTLDQIREQVRTRWPHALKVIDIIEEKAAGDTHYAADVEDWLTDPSCSTIWLRDEVMEPLRRMPEIVEIGKQFNPTTEWHNTWMPLDTAIHRERNGVMPDEW